VVAIETTGTRSTKTEGITRNPFSHRAHDKPQQALETLLRPTEPKVGSSNLSGRAEKAPRRRGFKSPLTRRPPPALVLAHAFSSSPTRHLTCAETRTERSLAWGPALLQALAVESDCQAKLGGARSGLMPRAHEWPLQSRRSATLSAPVRN
jgi:hypothetical protein